MLAAMFMTIEPVAGWPSGMPGKSRLSSGPKPRASRSTAPPFSPSRMIPSHRHITPVRPRAISKPVLARSKAALTIAAQTSASPATSQRPAATAKATKKNPPQILLSIGPS